MENKRLEFLISLLEQGGKHSTITWEEYGEQYNEHKEKVRKWWRNFKNNYAPQGLLFKGHPMSEYHKALWDRVKGNDTSFKETVEDSYSSGDSKEKFFDGEVLVCTGKSERSITSLEEALEFFEVDQEKFKVKDYTVKSYDVTMKMKTPVIDKETGKVRYYKHKDKKRTNYACRVALIPLDLTEIERVKKVVDSVIGRIPKRVVNKTDGSGIGTALIADLHLGARVEDLVRTPDFNVNILVEKLEKAAEKINAHGFRKVHVGIVGDLIESFSGLNHPDTFKSLEYGMYGGNLVELADIILNEHFFSKINNLEEIHMVAGNHDRTTPSKKVDGYGEFASIMAYIFRKSFGDSVRVNYNPLVLMSEIDNINYLITHGDKSLAKKDLFKTILDYRDNNNYTLLVKAHKHERDSKKALRYSQTVYSEYNAVDVDEMNYRAITLPPLFTGNFFSEAHGFGSTAGVVVVENNGEGKINLFDYTV